MAFDISGFYGITTTTLVVLSSATLAIFQYLSTSAINELNKYNNKLQVVTDDNGQLDKSCLSFSSDAISILETSHDKLQRKFKKYNKNLEVEIYALFIVIFLSAISILIVLFTAVFPVYGFDVSYIFGLNLVSIILFLISYLTFLVRLYRRRNHIRDYLAHVDDFLDNFDTEGDIKLKTPSSQTDKK